MTILGNWGRGLVEESLFKVEHLERILEQMREPIVLKDVPTFDWGDFKYFCSLISEEQPESIENE